MAKLDGTPEAVRHFDPCSFRQPILYVGMGEKLSDLEQFYPDRMASRILGMGDVMSLIEKAQANIDEESKSHGTEDEEGAVRLQRLSDSMEQIKAIWAASPAS